MKLIVLRSTALAASLFVASCASTPKKPAHQPKTDTDSPVEQSHYLQGSNEPANGNGGNTTTPTNEASAPANNTPEATKPENSTPKVDPTPAKPEAPANPDQPPTAAPAKLPFGKPVAGHKGFVTSPYDSNAGMIDVRDIAPGTKVRDPYTGKIFLVP